MMRFFPTSSCWVYFLSLFVWVFSDPPGSQRVFDFDFAPRAISFVNAAYEVVWRLRREKIRKHRDMPGVGRPEGLRRNNRTAAARSIDRLPRKKEPRRRIWTISEPGHHAQVNHRNSRGFQLLEARPVDGFSLNAHFAQTTPSHFHFPCIPSV